MFGFTLLAIGFVALFSALIAGLLHYRVRRWPMPVAEPGSPMVRRRGYLLLTESLAYVGAALLVAGGTAAIGERWREITGWEYVEIFMGAAILLFAIGFVAGLLTDPPVRRLTEISWLASVASVGAAAGIAAHAVVGTTGPVTTLAVGIVATAYSAGLWWISRKEPQLAAVVVGLVIAVCGFGLAVGGGSAAWLATALGLWVFGLGWAVLGWRYPQPLWTSLLVGAALALAAPGLAVWNHGWVYLVGIATAVAAVAAALVARVRPWSVVLLGLGSAGLLGYVTSAAIRYFHESLGLPVTLAVTGAFFICLAVISMRLRRSERPPEAGPEEPAVPAGPAEREPSHVDLPRAS